MSEQKASETQLGVNPGQSTQYKLSGVGRDLDPKHTQGLPALTC